MGRTDACFAYCMRTACTSGAYSSALTLNTGRSNLSGNHAGSPVVHPARNLVGGTGPVPMEDSAVDLLVENGDDECGVLGAVQVTSSRGVFGVTQEDRLSFLNF